MAATTRPKTAILAAIVVLWSLFSITPIVRNAQAMVGLPVTDPANTWAPYGPFINRLTFNVYSSLTTEQTAFTGGALDIVDLPLAPSSYLGCDLPAACTLSPAQNDNDMVLVDFNYASPTWGLWGCAFLNGLSACGVEIREAFAHLIDRPVIAGVTATALADPSPTSKQLATSVATQCTWETIPAHAAACVNAFNIAADPTGFAMPGSPDFCAAVDHLIQATVLVPALGLVRNPAAPLDIYGNNCGISPTSPGLPTIFANPIQFYIRQEDAKMLALGNGLTTTIDTLFGGAAVTPFLVPMLLWESVVLQSAAGWEMSTSEWTVNSPFVDHLLGFYSCAGVPSGRPENYDQTCIAGPAGGFTCPLDGLGYPGNFDFDAHSASQTLDITRYKCYTLAAFNQFGQHVGNIPVLTRKGRFEALTAVGRKVNAFGLGYPNFWTALNALGGAAAGSLRWGQQVTNTLNPFLAEKSSELNIIGEVYDTLFAMNPVDPTQVFCWMCDTYSITIDGGGNTHFLVELRQSLRWQDNIGGSAAAPLPGVPLDAYDVKFSLMNMKDFGRLTSRFVTQLSTVTVLASTELDITLTGQSLLYATDLAQVPIVPRHLLECPGAAGFLGTACAPLFYGDVGQVDPDRNTPTYDPITSGTFIGSGPFMCRSLFLDFNAPGTGCVKDPSGARGGQMMTERAKMELVNYDRTGEPATSEFSQYMRSFNPAWPGAFQSGQFQEFSWADKDDNAAVGITDLASVAACFGPAPTLGCPAATFAYWNVIPPPGVNVEDIVVASHIDDQWVNPYAWAPGSIGPTLTNIVPFTP